MSGTPAEIVALLELGRDAILTQSTATATHAERYAAVGEAETRERLDYLFAVLIESIETSDASPLVRHAEGIARARFASGFGLSDVQVAVNALEESMWRHVFATCPVEALGETLRVVSTALGLVKDVLAREYVHCAVEAGAPSLDLASLFAGTAAGWSPSDRRS